MAKEFLTIPTPPEAAEMNAQHHEHYRQQIQKDILNRLEDELVSFVTKNPNGGYFDFYIPCDTRGHEDTLNSLLQTYVRRLEFCNWHIKAKIVYDRLDSAFFKFNICDRPFNTLSIKERIKRWINL